MSVSADSQLTPVRFYETATWSGTRACQLAGNIWTIKPCACHAVSVRMLIASSHPNAAVTILNCVADSVQNNVVAPWRHSLKFSASYNRISVKPVTALLPLRKATQEAVLQKNYGVFVYGNG